MIRLAVLFLVVALGTALAGFYGVGGFTWEGTRLLALILLAFSVMYFAIAWWNRPIRVEARRQ